MSSSIRARAHPPARRPRRFPAALPRITTLIVDSLLKQFAQSSQLGANAAFVEDLYEQYLVAPDSVGPQWKAYFDGVRGGSDAEIPHSAVIDSIADAGRQAARGGVAGGGTQAGDERLPAEGSERGSTVTLARCCSAPMTSSK